MALRVVVDTNVWISGLILPDSLPGRVLQAIRDRRVEPVMSWPLAQEIVEVMRRRELAKYRFSAEDARDLLQTMRPWLPSVDVGVAVRDPDDALVIGAAVAGTADAIVTGDRDLLDDPDIRAWLGERNIDVLTPAELVNRLG